MLFLGIIWGAFHGRLSQVTEGALSAAGEAVTLSLTMVGIVAFWNGILEIGSRAGLVEQLSGKMRPILKFLFPDLPTDCEAARQISVNFIANILGLGWAATPAGLKAMKELEKIEEMRRKEGKLEDGEPTLEEMQIELPLEELKPHEEEENQERTIEEIAKDIPISSVMKRAEEEDAKREDLSVGDINPYTGHEYQSNSVRMHPSRIGYVQVYDRRTHKWKDMTEWAFLGEQERKKAMLGREYVPPVYLD